MKIVRDIRTTLKESGLKGVWKKYGWKLFAAFFVYYLIRDIIIYLLLPYLIYKGVTTS
ncbi:MAG: hypothetical protein H7326_08870 [Bdellovibrionaceae bacterium]|nr:hypothetical protein [Pseudobdellovibrionaceae bacterium]